MESWEITHFLFSREDDQCIYLYTKDASRNGKVVAGNYCFAELQFVDGELPKNIRRKNKWRIHFPVNLYGSVVGLLMTKPLVYLNWDKSINEFSLSVSDESMTYSRRGVMQQ